LIGIVLGQAYFGCLDCSKTCTLKLKPEFRDRLKPKDAPFIGRHFNATTVREQYEDTHIRDRPAEMVHNTANKNWRSSQEERKKQNKRE
jgi:hypothetical protein